MALGPTYVKLGQMIASSPGMFPAPLADACLRTLDDVPPFPAADAMAIVEDDLGAPTSELFAEVDPEPLSAASIAQVHACVLRDGRQAVLKVQRPAITDRMNRDLRIMFRIARLVDRTRTGHLLNAPGIVEDLHQVTNEELDFTLEADRQARFRANIGAFGDNAWITAPEVYAELCGPRVICMERLFGTPMDRFADVRARGARRRAGAAAGPQGVDGSRPRPRPVPRRRARREHLGARRRPRRVPRLRDHGRAAPAHRDAVRAGQYTVMIDGDYTRVVRSWQDIGILDADVGPVDEVAARLKSVLDPMFDLAIGEVSLAELLRQQIELQREYGARAARELVLVSKQLMYFERYAKELAPAYNMARDLYLLQNVFPQEVAATCAARGLTLPGDDVPNTLAPPSATGT